MDNSEKNAAKNQLEGLLDTLTDAKEYGSILNVENYNWDLLRRFVAAADTAGQISMESVGVEDTAEQLNRLVDIGETLARKYWVTATNPPYMSVSNAVNRINEYIQRYYSNSKVDMYAVFIERCKSLTKTNGFQAMITQHGWMFLGSFEKIREKIVEGTIVNMAHLGARAFEEIVGEVVQTTSFVLLNHLDFGYRGKYSRLVSFASQQLKEKNYLKHEDEYECSCERYRNIPGRPLAYWISEIFANAFKGKLLRDYAQTKQGFATGNNDLFLRLWFETEAAKSQLGSREANEAQRSNKKWYPCNKGGSYRKWYGNNVYIANWENDGQAMRSYKGSVIRNPQFYFRQGITWSSLANQLSLRYSPEGFIFESKGSMCYPIINDNLKYLLGLLNCKVTSEALAVLSPTLDFHEGPMAKVPVLDTRENTVHVNELVENCVGISRDDWDSFETSWDFQKHPLLRDVSTISEAFTEWQAECDDRFHRLKANEEELNRIFIEIYGLQNELTPEVADKDVTVHRIFDTKDAVPESMKGSNYVRTMRDEVVSLISYAVGCMFGRYSLDAEELAYAGGAWDSGKYRRFIPDEDNVIPITDEEYLDDDIVSRLLAWLKAAYGADMLEENLDFIAKALGNKGSTSREIIRNYFLNDFFKDHCQTYSVTGSGKRPIYWLFDSGKQNGFKALVYLHRYTPDTIGNLRVDYLHKMQRIYESEINRMQDTIDHSTNVREVAAATKRKEKLQKQLKECREYDEKIGHLALSRIELDLDDGVKKNYRKIQTAVDGKFYEVLADSNTIMAKEK